MRDTGDLWEGLSIHKTTGSFTIVDSYESVHSERLGDGVWDHRTLSNRKSTFILNN